MNASGAEGKGGERKPRGAAGPWSHTVDLPVTTLPMRAEASLREVGLQAACVGRLWAWQREGGRAGDVAEAEARAANEDVAEARRAATEKQRVFHLHDGPPYANGPAHVGHALNRVAKDVVNRYRLLRGDRIAYVPGWDCHGLPIEAKAVKQLEARGESTREAGAVRREARGVAEAAVAEQAAAFRRWGVLAGWDEDAGIYRTMDPGYEGSEMRVLLDLVRAGKIHRGRRPVHWSPSSRTALAEAELEFVENHESLSAHVALDSVEPSTSGQARDAGALIWTTTPWTLPSHRAVAVHPDLAYVVVKHQMSGWRLVVGLEQLEQLRAQGGPLADAVPEGAPFFGRDLAGARWRHPVGDGWSPTVMAPGLVRGGGVGTGLVHLAPQHGFEDYEVLKSADEIQDGWEEDAETVDADGLFTAAAGVKELEGIPVLEGGSEAVLAWLRGRQVFVHSHMHAHRWPYDWRTKRPTIVRATPQWFCKVDAKVAEAVLDAGSVGFVPASGGARLRSTLGARTEWCISRQRPWGLPIPAMHAKDGSGAVLMDEALVERVAEVVSTRGSDAWWEVPVEEWLIGRTDVQADDWVKGNDTLDVWFDSGSSWRAVSQDMMQGDTKGSNVGREGTTPGFPADLVVEGSDQHRGWFQSSLLTSAACTGQAPYRRVWTHGFVTDGDGRKMSKSEGNVVDPRDIVEGNPDKNWPAYGADVLRVWVALSNVTSSRVSCTHANVEAASTALRAVRNVLRFLLGALHGFDPSEHAVPLYELRPLDAYVLHERLVPLRRRMEERIDALDLASFFHGLVDFERDMSSFYLAAAKRRLYCSPRATAGRRSAQTVLFHTLHVLVAALAPVAPHTAEDVFQHMPDVLKADKSHFSAFQAGWMHVLDEALTRDMVTDVKDTSVTAALVSLLESARWAELVNGAYAVGMLDGKAQERRLDKARVTLYVGNGALRGPLETLEANFDLAELLGAAEVHVRVVDGDVDAFVRAEAGPSWRFMGNESAQGMVDAVSDAGLELTHEGTRVAVAAVVQRSLNARCSRCRLYTLPGPGPHVDDALCPRCATEVFI